MENETKIQRRWAKLQGLHVLRDEPGLRVLVVDLSNRCNFNCLYCYGTAESFNKSGKILTKDRYVALFHEAKQIGIKTIWFLGGHENTLQFFYLELVEDAEKIGLFTVTLTNGAAFGDDNLAQRVFGLSSLEMCCKIANMAKSSVILKCDSFRSDVQNELAGNKNASQQISNALVNFESTNILSLTNDSDLPRFGLNSVLTKLNYQDIGDVLQYALSKGMAYFCDMLLNSGSAVKNVDKLSLTSAEFSETVKDIGRVFDLFGIRVDPKEAINCYTQECTLFSNFLFVSNTGDVLPCAGFPRAKDQIGHIRDSLSSVWMKKQKMIDQYMGRDPSCKKCPSRMNLEDNLFKR